MKKRARGFTLIEILVVLGIIAVLAAIVIIAINPAKQFAQARNAQRQSNIETILDAIGQRMADNQGIFQGPFPVTGGGAYTCPTLPSFTAPSTTQEIYYYSNSNGVADYTQQSGDLSCLVPTYIATFPFDPTMQAANSDTGYYVYVNSVGRITVCAPKAAEPSIPGATQLCVTR